ncbi:MAG: HDOD domain-containing protein [Hahellaceae bacterium]|nr:HDOD domain-containing protein [Hahellaceae bacterium]
MFPMLNSDDECLDILMARQPIYDTQSQLYGYELLFRSAEGKSAEVIGWDEATSEVVVNLCASINRQYESLKQPLFINITRSFLLSDAFFPVDPAAVVLELLEHTQVDDSLIASLEVWRKKGFRFALDDYDFDPRFDPVLPYMDFIKVDLLIKPLDFILERVSHIDKHGCKLIAEKVEDKTVLIRCRDAGFDLFQGYYLAVPDKVFGKRIRPSAHALMQVLQKIQSEEASIEEIARVVANEPRLVYQLLRVLNSPASRLRHHVENIRDAVVYLGITQLKKWTLLILLSSSGEAQTELVRILLTRARACERYAEMNGQAGSEKYFMAGLLSGIDLLLQVEKAVAMAHIRLEPELQKAVLIHEGPVGQALDHVFDVEGCHWESLGKLPVKLRRNIFVAHLEGGVWAHQTLEAMSTPA